MKKIILLFFTALLSVSLFAQDNAGTAEKNAGNAAWKAKNYSEAFVNFEKYLQAVNFEDKAYVYNTAVAAMKAKKLQEAEKYYDMSVKNKYKLADSYFGKAKAQEDQKRISDMVATLDAGMKALPGNSKLENMYASHFLQQAVEAQKSKNVSKATENFNKVLKLTNNNQKVKAYMGLASLQFNNGAGILQAASEYANTDKTKFAAEKLKATNAFKTALGYVGKVTALDAANADAADLKKQIEEAMKQE